MNRNDESPTDQQTRTRHLLTALNVEFALSRLRLKAGFNPNQPRVPAGNPDGGQWTDDGGSSAGGVVDTGTSVHVRESTKRDHAGEKPWSSYSDRRDESGKLISRTARMRDGSTIVSEFPTDSIERISVTLADGDRIIMESEQAELRFFDGRGRLLGTEAWPPRQRSDNARIHRVFSDPRRKPLESLIGAGFAVYNWLSSTGDHDSGAVLDFRADEFRPGDVSAGQPPLWVGRRTREEIERVCPGLPTVQAISDRAAAVHHRNLYANKAVRGTAIHLAVKNEIDTLPHLGLRTEVSIIKAEQEGAHVGGLFARYGSRGSVRIDVLEKLEEVVCVYDLKTGASILTRARGLEIVANVAKSFGDVDRILLIEVRPRQ